MDALDRTAATESVDTPERPWGPVRIEVGGVAIEIGGEASPRLVAALIEVLASAGRKAA